MTPTQREKLRDEFICLPEVYEDPYTHKWLIEGKVDDIWQWFESKLEEVEANLFKGIDTCTDRKCKCRLKDGVCQDWACVCPTCQLLKSLKSNKLGGKE